MAFSIRVREIAMARRGGTLLQVVRRTRTALSMSVSESSIPGADTARVTLTGVTAIASADMIDVALIDGTVEPAVTRDFGLFEIASEQTSQPAGTTTLQLRRVFDERGFVETMIDDALGGGAWPPARRAAYPFHLRWERLLRPTTAVAGSPGLFDAIRERMERGQTPSLRHAVSVLAEFGLEIWRTENGDERQLGLSAFAFDGSDYAIVPMWHVRNALATAIAENEFAPRDADASTSSARERPDEHLDREIRVSTSSETGDDTRTVHTGGTRKPAVILKDPRLDEYHAAVAIEGERVRRYMTNRTGRVNALLDATRRLRDHVSLPARFGGGNWTVVGIDRQYTPTSASQTLHLRARRTPTNAQIYANSPAPFNAESGWVPYRTVPNAPTLALINWNAATEANDVVIPSGDDPTVTSTDGGGFLIRIQSPATAGVSLPVTETNVNVLDGTELVYIDRVEGHAARYLWRDGEAGTTYTVRVSLGNRWGESAPSTITVALPLNGRPAPIIGSMIPKIIADQAPYVADEAYAAYQNALGEYDTGASNGLAAVAAIAAVIALPGIVFAGSAALAVLLTALGGGTAFILTSTGVLLPITIGGFAALLSVSATNFTFFVVIGSGAPIIYIQLLTATLVSAVASIAIAAFAILGLAAYIVLAARRDGIVLSGIADGNGYAIRRVRVQHRKRATSASGWGGWEDTASVGGGSDLQVRAENPSATRASFVQLASFTQAEINVGSASTQEIQFRVAVITSVNMGIEDNNDALHTRGDWLYSKIMRYADCFRLWVNVEDGSVERAPVIRDTDPTTGIER